MRLLQRYIDPDAPAIKGAVTVDGKIQPWTRSMTVDTRRATGITPDAVKGFRRSGVRFKPVVDRVVFNTQAPAKRAPQTRVEALTARYVKEWKRGNEAILAGLLSEVCSEYWKMGQPVTAEALRMLAAKSLADAEKRQEQANRGRSTRR